MATLTIKNIPDKIYQGLKQQALLHRRSLNSEVIISLEQVLGRKEADPSAVLSKARKVRAKSVKFHLTEKILVSAKKQGRE